MKTQPSEKNKISFLKSMFYVTVAGMVSLLLPACSKENANTDKAHMSVRMTDAPANYNAVLIDVQDVEIKTNGGDIMLNVNAGIYNLLDFSNGLDTLIASGDLDAGTVSQIRLILGPNNTVVVDNVSHPLATPSAEQSGLKIQVHKTLEPGVSYAILLDFDANESIVLQGNGEYKLKPVIRTVDVSLNGSVRGSIVPAGTAAVITVTNGVNSYTSVANANGEFLVAGIPAGTYDVEITPAIPFLPVTISGVTVSVGGSTHIGLITL
jgi:hypothetical protein